VRKMAIIPPVKPCPFCGELPRLFGGFPSWGLRCVYKRCKVQPGTNSQRHAAIAVRIWNKRHESKPKADGEANG
jgi:hypothetical protein